MRTLFLLAILVAFSPGRLAAELSFANTPEWLAHRASLSFVGVPHRVVISPLAGTRRLTAVQFRIDRRIKGPLSPGDLVTVSSLDFPGGTDPTDLQRAVETKREVLVLATIAEHTLPETDGRYLFLPPSPNRLVCFADEPVNGVYTEAGKAIRDYSEVLARIVAQSQREADWVHRHWPGEIVERQVEAEWETDAQRELFNGSAVLLHTIEYREPGQGASPARSPDGGPDAGGKALKGPESK